MTKMNPYHELKLKYLNKEISLDLYQKTLKLLEQLEKKDKLQKEQQLKEQQSKILDLKAKDLKAKELQEKILKEKVLKAKELQEKILKEKVLKEKELKMKELERKKEIHVKHLELLKNQSLAKATQKEFLYKISRMSPKEKLEFLSNLEIIMEFGNEHNHSKKVVLLEGFIVRKQCQLDSFGNFMFQNEIKALNKLSPYPHFPIIVAIDPYNLIIYMTYCGETLDSSNIPSDWKNQFDEISQILEVLDVNSNDMLLRNTCIFNGEISIIDFGLYTQFGRDLKTVLGEFYQRLSSISPKKISNDPMANRDRDYNKDYPKWRERLEKVKAVKAYINNLTNLNNTSLKKRKS